MWTTGFVQTPCSSQMGLGSSAHRAMGAATAISNNTTARRSDFFLTVKSPLQSELRRDNVPGGVGFPGHAVDIRIFQKRNKHAAFFSP